MRIEKVEVNQNYSLRAGHIELAERHEMVIEWNDSSETLRHDACFHRLFAAQADRWPEKTALVFEDQAWTYRQLDRRANQLAHKLRRLGVGLETRVGLCLERGPELIVALLGVLKSGGAYVPFDPTYPEERLAFMRRDSRVHVLLTRRSLEGLDGPTTCPASGVGLANLAYMMYTSGSTGRPKGVLVSHRGLANVSQAQQEAFDVGSGDRVLQFAAFSYDASVWEFVMALATGATLQLAPSDALYPGPGLHRLLRDRRVTHITVAPTALAAMPEDPLPDLRTLIVAGEECPRDVVRRWAVGRSLFNAYGPTESTIWATVDACRVASGRPVDKPSIGRPIANFKVYLVDDQFRVVSLGHTGELLLRADLSLARGYFERPALTAEKFVPNPFAPNPFVAGLLAADSGARLYRTGDLARFLGDGRIEFLGRRDAQVKLRGYRIELDEIEAALKENSSLLETVVLAREDEPGHKRLVAYVVLKQGSVAERKTIAELRDQLRERLPEFMVPTAIVRLDILPRLPNGKVDRRSLPPPALARPELGTDFVAPRSRAEQFLASIWAEVLRVERVGLHDNYFDLGGDSILAMQVIARAREAGLYLTPKQLFRYPTVAEQAAVAAKSVGSVEGSPRPWTGELPLTPIEYWFFELGLARPDHWNQSVMLQTPPGFDGATLRTIMARLIHRHDALRLRFEQRDGVWRRRVVAPSGEVPVTVVDLPPYGSWSPTAAWRHALTASAGQAQSSLRLSEGPLLRSVLFQMGPDQPGRLLIVIHHLAVDGVSWRILLEELNTGVLRLRDGHSLKSSLKHWADRLTDHAASTVLVAEPWRRDPEVVPLPRDGPSGKNLEASASTVVVSLSALETERLLAGEFLGAPRAHEVLLASVVETLVSWTGSGRLVVDVEGHGREGLREADDFSRTVGWFTTLYPLVLDPSREPVHRTWRAMAEQSLNFGVLRYLRRDLPALRPPEVVFNFLGSLDALTDGTLAEGDGFRLAREPMGPWRDPRNARTHVIEITAFVLDGRLRVLWTFSRNLHRRGTLVRWARRFKAHLRAALPAIDRQEVFHLEAFSLEPYPLSPLQEGMLYHSRLAPGSGVYVEQFHLTLEGNLDPATLRGAWRSLIASHAMLRTACQWVGEEQPSQQVFSQVETPWTELDWRGEVSPEFHQGSLKDRLEAFLEEDRRRDLVLSEPPLLRLTLIRTSEFTWQWIWTYHHLLLDGWSVGILLKDLLQRYDLLASGRQPTTTFSGRPYPDYVDWLGQIDSRRRADYWRLALGDFTAATPLAVEFSSLRREIKPSHGDRDLSLKASTTTAVGEMARRYRCTPSILVQATWALLLGRYSQRRDVVFGLTVATRPAELAGVESMVGLMINTLPARVRLPEDVSLLNWLRGVQEGQLELLEHDTTPLVEARGWSGVPADQPLFESLLVYESYPLDRSFWQRFQRFEVRQLRGFGWTSYPLTVLAVPGSRFLLRVKYDRHRFDDSTASRLLKHFATLLESLARGSGEQGSRERTLADLSLLTPIERHQMTVEWNATRKSIPLGVCIHQLFEAQVRRTPESVALVAGDTQLSYGGLDFRAQRLAHALRGLGVAPEVCVGLCLERGAAQIVALLAILKAGGAYLPLDPQHPAARREALLKQAGSQVCLSQVCLAELEMFRAPLAAHQVDSSQVSGGNLAYVLFTSGSTGRPKGVAIKHRQLVNYVVDVLERLDLRAPGRFLMVQPLTVDSSVTALYPPLVTGGTLHLVTREQAVDPRALGVELLRRPADYLKIAPSHLEALAVLGGPAPFLPRRGLVIGGEGSRWRRTRELAALAPGQLFSHYGPTETTVGVLAGRVDPGGPGRALQSWTPLGRPLANTGIYILDRHLELIAFGAPGELCVSGESLARGYLGLPGQTARAFIPNLFRGSGVRLYRTGDLARYLADGVVEFLGRLDHQVKVRGYRLELGEVEAVLVEHPDVRNCVVTLGAATLGAAQKLTAHTVGPSRESVAELREFLHRRLPAYMVPQDWAFPAALPLTPHGKVDRRALAELDVTEDNNGQLRRGGFRAPSTPIEELLAGLWSQVLGVPRVSVTDSFFELGGHSLLATRVISRILDLWRVELPLRSLFEAPTVAELAERIEAEVRAGSTVPVVPLVPGKAWLSSSQPSFAQPSFAQERLWFLDQLGAGSAYNMLEAVRLVGRLDPLALQRSLAGIVTRHETLRTSFPAVNGEPRQCLAAKLELPLPSVDMMALPRAKREQEARRQAAVEAHRPFDLASGPLIRCCLLRMNARGGRGAEVDEHVLLLALHHIVADGWSMGVLRREIGLHYRGWASGLEPNLPVLPVQYVDFALWQRDWLSGEVLENQLAYWRQRLAGLPDLDLPTDHPRPSVRSYRGALLPWRIPQHLAAGLRQLGAETGATLFMVLLATFKVLLHHHTGQRDFAVGSPIAGRNRSEVEGLIGFFVNTLVLRGDFAGNPSFKEWLGSSRDLALGAYAHQDLPFEKLVQELRPERDLARSPLFQVMFVLQNTPKEAVEIPGLTLCPLAWQPETAIFDLALSVEEEAPSPQPSLSEGEGARRASRFPDAPAGLLTWWRYAADLFDRSTVQRFARHFEVLLSAVVSDPAARLESLPVLTPAEAHQLCREWNQTGPGPVAKTAVAKTAVAKTVVEMFDRVVAASSEATAVTLAGSALSYGGLAVRAELLARYLRRRGVGRGSRVGLSLPRSIDLMVGLLAILKAGAAYVPLDLAQPAARLAYMISTSGVSILLTWQAHRQALSGLVSEVICLDQFEGAVFEGGPFVPPDMLDLAYVIFTSGSTGRPKGVAMPHGPVANLITWHLKNLLIGVRSLQRASLSFDGSFHEIFATWCSGGVLELAPEDLRRDIPALLRRLILSGIEKAKLPVVALDHLAEAWRAAGRPRLALRELTVSGSALRITPQVLEFCQGHPHLVLHNHYGPSEAHMVIAHPVMSTPSTPSHPPIGRPIDGVQVYILDRQGRSVALGVTGEIILGGACPARGYVDAAAPTATRFLPDPWSWKVGRHAGGRLYRTGDLARFRADGRVEFLGRRDHQVKIRGFRIEPGEIEVVAMEHPGVQQAVVLVDENRDLVLYMVPVEPKVPVEPAPSWDELSAHLRGRLPEFMVPRGRVVLESPPLTVSGKVDRGALPRLEEAGSEIERQSEYVAPEGAVQEEIATLWREILGVSRVGADDNFFALGGHSLRATRLVSRLQHSFGVELPVRVVFEEPTVARMELEITRRLVASEGGADLGTMVEAIQELSEDELREILGGEDME